MYGHASHSCHVKSRCVKSTGSHHSKVCRKPAEVSPICVNCGGDHPSSYLGCTENPLNRPKPKTAPATTKRLFVWGQHKNKNLRTHQPANRVQPQQQQQSNDQVTNVMKSIMKDMIKAMFEEFRGQLNRMSSGTQQRNNSNNH